jgi:cytochrome c-type biogenesis protein CcmH
MKTWRNRPIIGCLLLAIGILLIATPATAQEPTPSDDEVNAIAKQLYCPVCENVPLDVCPTKACDQWRETIRDKLALGWNEDQIKQYFVDQYGVRVLAVPPAKGLNWLVIILPPAAFLIGVYLLFRTFQAWRKPLPEDARQPPDQDEFEGDPYVARLEEELRKWN